MNDPVSQTDFRQLKQDVKEIKDALLGNNQFGQKGYLQRLEELEADVERLKSFKQKLVWYTAGAAGVVTLIVQIGVQYI